MKDTTGTNLEAMSLYEMLGVSLDATSEEIMKAFRIKSLQFHPDKLPASQKTRGTKIFTILEEAKRLLLDRDTRKVYDIEGIEAAREAFNAKLEEEDSGRPTSSPDPHPTTLQPTEATENLNSTPVKIEEADEDIQYIGTVPGWIKQMYEDAERRSEEFVSKHTETQRNDDVELIESKPPRTQNKSPKMKRKTTPKCNSSKCDDAKEDIYQVEEILSSKTIKGKDYYLLKWVGYDEPTWEKGSNLRCYKLLKRFLLKKKILESDSEESE